MRKPQIIGSSSKYLAFEAVREEAEENMEREAIETATRRLLGDRMLPRENIVRPTREPSWHPTLKKVPCPGSGKLSHLLRRPNWVFCKVCGEKLPAGPWAPRALGGHDRPSRGVPPHDHWV